jgi:5-methylcytosine-specific restriction endonuclease McrA
MHRYSMSHLPPRVLVANVKKTVATRSQSMAVLLAELGEIDARKLYVAEGYSSMLAFCIEELGMEREAAEKRLRAARVARQFPAVFPAIAERRLYASGVLILAPHLTPENAEELFGLASGKNSEELWEFVALRFRKTEAPLFAHGPEAAREPALERVGSEEGDAAEQREPALERVGLEEGDVPERREPALERVGLEEGDVPERREPALERVGLEEGDVPACRALERAAYRRTIHMDQEIATLMSRAQELLGYELRSDNPKEVLRRSLQLLIEHLERRAARAPRASQARQNANPRHIPRDVMAAVWERDEGRCTFVGAHGHRCESRDSVEFDHIEPVARGGMSTFENLRLRCRTHNQFEAERVFGADFMRRKRKRVPSADMESVSA